MSTRSNRGTGAHRRSRKPKRPFVATAAAIGASGIALVAPGAALMANAPEAQAQTPLDPSSPFSGPRLGGIPGAGGANPLAIADPIFTVIGDIGGAIPIFDIFVSNGANGTNASINPVTGAVTQATAGGNAGFFCCNGGAGGNGADGVNGTCRAMFRPPTAQPAAMPASSATAATAAAAAAASAALQPESRGDDHGCIRADRRGHPERRPWAPGHRASRRQRRRHRR